MDQVERSTQDLPNPVSDSSEFEEARRSRTRVRVRCQKGFSLIELMATVAIVGILVKMGIPAYQVMRQRVYNMTALSDVMNAGKALEAMDSTKTFTQTTTGPAAVPNLPGPRVSRGTVLYVRRWLTGATYNWYVRGSHRNGTVTYYFQNGVLSGTGA